MFARKVFMRLKPNSVPEFTERLDKELIPLLRKQKGFQDEITFIAPQGREALGISLWDLEENAEAYDRVNYGAVIRILEKVVDGRPRAGGLCCSGDLWRNTKPCLRSINLVD